MAIAMGVKQRTDPHSQEETRVVARLISDCCKCLFPPS